MKTKFSQIEIDRKWPDAQLEKCFIKSKIAKNREILDLQWSTIYD